MIQTVLSNLVRRLKLGCQTEHKIVSLVLNRCFCSAADVQVKLQSQLRCLEEKLEHQTTMVSEIQDFFRRRAEIEVEYSQRLEKLAKHFLTKQKQEKQK